jgi:hypothetical protein
MTISAHLRDFRMQPLRLALSVVLGLALIVFTVTSGASHMHSGSTGQSHLIASQAPHHVSHDGHFDGHATSAWCGSFCAVSILTLSVRSLDMVRLRGVPPAIMARVDEHSPDDPLPPPRRAAKI